MAKKPSKIDKISLEHIIQAIDHTTTMIEDDTIYEYVLDVKQLLKDLLKGRS